MIRQLKKVKNRFSWQFCEPGKGESNCWDLHMVGFGKMIRILAALDPDLQIWDLAK
jgi:hypothetical protein